MSAVKRAVTKGTSPLDDAGILLHILSILGPGHHLFISAVSRAWKECYESVASGEGADPIYDYYYDEEAVPPITQQTTLCSAAFTSFCTVNLAHQCGLTFNNRKLQRLVGRSASILALQAALDLGLQLSDEVLSGAAEAASLPKLQWLHTEHSCAIPQDACCQER
jgi:hypothetical protein